MMTTISPTQLDCHWSVNEVIARHPATIAAFDAHGIDTCCGGAVSVEQAAREAQVDPLQLCVPLTAAIDAAA